MYRMRVAKEVTVKNLLFSWKRIGVAAKSIVRAPKSYLQFQNCTARLNLR